MTLPGRRLKKYHPRRSRKVLSIQKQEFLDCLHTLDLEAGRLIVLCKEGSVDEIQKAQAKARSVYLKFKDQLLELASKIQETVTDRAQSYLNEYHKLVDSALSYEESVFQGYYNALLKIKALASLKSKGLNLSLDSENQSRSA
jgi:hypothetical protein